jgi:hypothetical protein
MQFSRDIVAGVAFLLMGLLIALASFQYQVGTATHMGPGFFPLLIGVAMASLGAVTAIKAFNAERELQSISLREIRLALQIIVAVVAFGLLAEPAGAVPAIAASTIVSRLAGGKCGLLEMAILIVALCAIACGIFIFGLGVPLRLLWIS